MITKPPPEVLTTEKLSFMSTLNEYQRRRYLGTEALAFGKRGVDKISQFFGVSKNTVYSSIEEIESGYSPVPGHIRRPGGGRKALLGRHPEWIDTLKLVIAPHVAGLPQDENVIWVSMSVPMIAKEMSRRGCDASEYIVRQILDSLGFRRRSFTKDLPMKDVKDRDAQFRNIADIREKAAEINLPIISIDTKKKELIGNFKRDGKVMAIGHPKSLDHDFATFSDGQIVPHGIYDVTKNVGYMTIGTSHDTSKFVCDNIERVWNEHLREQYPEANTIVILCDGGGSNSSSHRIVKQDLLKLASRLDMNLLVMHYPPYCSKYNPIEHRLFSQITRSWSGAPLLSVKDAADRAAATTTSKGLTVYVDINTKTYEIQRPIDESYEKDLKHRIIFQENLPKWNYLVKPV
jgi:Rhodopirellula transposase.